MLLTVDFKCCRMYGFDYNVDSTEAKPSSVTRGTREHFFSLVKKNPFTLVGCSSGREFVGPNTSMPK